MKVISAGLIVICLLTIVLVLNLPVSVPLFADTDDILINQNGSTPDGISTDATSQVPGLFAYYPFNGDVQDYSGSGYHGTNNGATFVSGINGQSLNFNGKDNFVSAPVNINPDMMPQITITAWVRAENASPNQQVISHDNGNYDRSVGIDYRGGGIGWSCFSGSGAVLGYREVSIGEWVFLAVVYDQAAAKVRLYVNDTMYEETGTLGSGWDYINIGRNPSFGEYFAGAIDDVRIYNEALDTDEISLIRANPGLVPDATPVPTSTPTPVTAPPVTTVILPPAITPPPVNIPTPQPITLTPAPATPSSSLVLSGAGLTFGSRSKPSGSTIQIPLTLQSAKENMGNMDITLSYDPAVLKASEAMIGSLTSHALFDFNISGAGSIKISLADKSGFSGDGSVAYIIFNVIGTAGATSPLKIASVAANRASDTASVIITTHDGIFKVSGSEQLKGDYNGDGRLTPLDALAALQMAVGKRAEEPVIDVTGDGKVTSLDAREILKMAVSQASASIQTASEVTLRTLSSEQLQIIDMFGWPHSFSLVAIENAEGNLICSETWTYYDGQTSYIFLDGVFRSWEPVESIPGDSIAVPYRPDAFTLGASVEDVRKTLAPGDTLEPISDFTPFFRNFGEGAEMYAAPQVITVFYEGRLVYLEGTTLVPLGGE
jgi:hypothetical protein